MSAASVTTAPSAPLRRQPAFVWLWAAMSVSVFSDQGRIHEFGEELDL